MPTALPSIASDPVRTALSLPAGDAAGWDALATSLAVDGYVPGLVAALESRLSDPGAVPPATRFRILLSLARLGRDVDLALEERLREAAPVEWLELAVEADPDVRSRAGRLSAAARDGAIVPRDLASLLPAVAASAYRDMAGWLGELVEAFPENGRLSATAVLVAGFGVVPLA